MTTNNFKRLMATEEERIAPPSLQEIKQNVTGSMGVFKFFGQIVELYLPKVFEMLVAAVGGSGKEQPDRGPQHPAGSASKRTGNADLNPRPGI